MKRTLVMRLIVVVALLVSSLLPIAGGRPVQAATGTWTDNDFTDGSFGGTELAAGEVALLQTQEFLDEFEAGSLDPAWELDNWLNGVVGLTFGASTVTATGGDYIRTVPEFVPGYTVEGEVQFTDGGNSHFGFADTIQGGTYGIPDPSWALFSVRNSEFLARTRLGGTEQNEVLAGITIADVHTLRIVWNAASIEFYVDDVLQTTHTRTFDFPLRVYSSSNLTQPITVDRVHVYGPSAYVSGGTYTSNTFDAGEYSDFTTFSSTTTEPAGTSISFETRTSADASAWTAWEAVAGGAIASPDNRYIEYRATLTADGTNTPLLQEVVVGYVDDSTPPDAPTGMDAIPGDGQITVNWNAVSDPTLTRYYLHYGPNPGGPYNGTDASEGPSPVDVGTATGYTLTGLTNGMPYYVVVSAEDAGGNESLPSGEDSATPQLPDPEAPIVLSASPTGVAVPVDTWCNVTFSEPMDPTSFSGTINGAPIVPTQVVWNGDSSALDVDLGEVEYAQTFSVVVAGTTRDVSGNPLQGGDYVFGFTTEDNSNPKRPATTVVLPPGPFEAGQPYEITGQATGYIWERDAGNPLELWHWDQYGTNTGDRPMLHPTAIHFPGGMDGYTHWLFYTPYPPGASENPVLVRSNDGVNFDFAGVPANPLFTYNIQPPYDMQNLADPEAYRLGETWMLFYEMETPASTAASIGPWMHGGGYIGLALSDDGLTWGPYGGPYTYDSGNPPTGFPPDGNPVIYPESTVWYENSTSAKTGEIGVFFKDGQYHLWRTVLGAGLFVVYDTASDPRGPWAKQDVAVSFTSGGLGPHPDVVYDPQRDIYLMLILIPDSGQLGIWTADDPAGPWTAHPLNPIFSAQGGWEGSGLYRATLVQVGDQWYMYYSGNPGGDGMIGLAREVPGVRQVEVSVNGGGSWLPAAVAPDGSWTFDWTPPSDGVYTVQARVTDDLMQGDATPGSDVIVGAGSLLPAENPILVVRDSGHTANPFGTYLAEILRGEGLVEFQEAELASLMLDPDPLAYLNSFEVVILAETLLETAEETLLRSFVSGGGVLIAMRPDPDLADLFGLTYVGARTEQLHQFFDFDTSSVPGAGIVDTSLQYHGVADEYILSGAVSLGDLYDTETTPSAYPAVTLNDYGSGQAMAFTFDLAQSIVLVRQGNPAWAGIDGDGLGGYRPLDLYASGGDTWLANSKLRIPQADEKQRFLANLILSVSGKPLPRMWYLPGDEKTVIVTTGDSDGASPAQCEQEQDDIAGYGGVMTNYMIQGTLSATDAVTEAAWRAAGHETSIHPEISSNTWAEGMSVYTAMVGQFQTQFGHSPRTVRNHTLDWIGWTEMPEVQELHGVRMDANNYHYATWLADRTSGYMTGSGLPQRFVDENGQLIDVYQVLTEWADEWFVGQGYTAQGAMDICERMILDSNNGYYSAFVANIHQIRYANHPGEITQAWAHLLWSYAQTNGIPLWSAEMLLDFTDARNGAQFDNMVWNGTDLAFDFSAPVAGQDLTLMIPASFGGADLESITVDGGPQAYTTELIKGRSYAMFTLNASSAAILASYGQDLIPPVITNVQAVNVGDTTATITWDTNEPATSRVDYGVDPGNLNLSETVPGFATSHSVPLTGLAESTTYHYQVTSEDMATNSASSSVLDFTTSLPRWVETTVADFEDGTLTDIEVTSQGDGAFQLAPTTGFYDHFEGTTLNATDWLSRNIAGNPVNVTVAGSWVTTADVTYIRTNQTFFQQTVEGLVELADGPNAHFGFANTVQSGDDGIDDPHWMIFSAVTGDIVARTRLNDGQGDAGGQIDTILTGISPGMPHHFKIVWNPDNTIEFWVDGYLEATHTRAFAENLRVYLTSNAGQTGGADWISVTGEYSLAGTYESSVFDAGGEASFDILSWTGTTPAGAGVVFETQSSVDGATWSGWVPLGAGSSVDSPDGRYLQYRAALSTSDPSVTPIVEEVVVTYQPGPDTTPPVVISTDPLDTATGVPIEGNITIEYNEPINPGTFAATLNSVPIPGGEISFQNGGRTVVINPASDLEYLTGYTVEIAAGVQDLSGNPTTAAYSFSFTTTALLFGWIETTVADFEDGTLVDTQVTSTGDGEVTLAQSFFDHFPGTALDPANWTAEDWGGGLVEVTVASSIVTVSGSDYIKSVPTFSESVAEGYVRYGASGAYLNFAVGTDLNAPCTFMTIGPATAGQMRVQTYDSVDPANPLTNLTTFLPAFNGIISDGLFHYVKIEWSATEARYYIDNPDVPVATHTGFGRPLDGAYNLFMSSSGVAFEGDWIGIAGYPGSGTYTSSIFDAGATSVFSSLAWLGSEPAGTGVSFETRTSLDNATWSPWVAVGGGGAIASPVGQYVQYRATLTSSDPVVTPIIEEVAVSYAPGDDTTPPSVVSTDPVDGAIDVPVGTDITIDYDEPINPATFGATISGGVSFATTFENGNTRVVLNPDADLGSQIAYNVEIAAGVQDVAGNPTAAAYNFGFTTERLTWGLIQTTVADFESGVLDGLVVTEDGDGELQLAPTLYDAFLGTTLGSQWTSGLWGGGAYSPIVAGGVISHTNPGGGAYVRSLATFETGTTLQGRFKFSRGGNATAPYLYFGFAGDGLVPWALIGTHNTGDQIYASVYPGYGPVTFPLGDLFEEWHHYKIVWNVDNVEFWVDGVLQHTETVAPAGPLSVYMSASGSAPAGAYVASDWVRVEEYVEGSETLVPQLSDSFPEADGPPTNWESMDNPVPSTGDWSVVSNELVHGPSGTSYHPAVLNNTFPAYSDFVLETRVMSPDATGLVGLVWGLQSNAQYYFAQFYAGQGMRVYRLDNWFTSYEQIGDFPGAPVPIQDQWLTLRVEGRGGTYDIYVDDVLYGTVVDSTYPSGRIGVLGYGGSTSHYDDVLVHEIQTTTGPPGPGTYTSAVLDAGLLAEWLDLSWTGSIPTGGSVTYETRSGDTPIVDGTWSGWEAVSSPIASPDGRYIQYRATLVTADTVSTPVVEEVAITYGGPGDTTPPSVVSTDPTDGAIDVLRDTNITIEYHEPINPATFNATISGGVSFATTFENGDQRVVLNPDADLASQTAHTVEIAAGVEDVAGNPTTATYNFGFTTEQQTWGLLQTTVADFGSGVLDGLVITEDGDGELQLTPTLYDPFPGTALGGQWTSGGWDSSAYSPIVAGGVMSHTNPGPGVGAWVRSVESFETGIALQGRFKFSKGGNAIASHLYFGFGGDGLVPWALIGSGYDGDQIYASVYPGYGPVTFGLGDLFEEWHHYKIVWNVDNVEFWVDGVLQHTETVAPAGPLSVFMSAGPAAAAGSYVAADWVRVEEYPGTSSEILVEQLSDSFPEADGPPTNWESVGNPIPSPGDWSVLSNELVHGPAGDSYHPAVLDNSFPAYSDFVFETRAMSPDATGIFGLVWGLQDNRHYYFAQFYQGQGMRVFRLDDWFDDFTQIGNFPTAPVPVTGQWFTLRLEGGGGTYEIYVDDVLYGTVADGTYPSGRIGVIGYGGNTSHYDDVLVHEIQITVDPPAPGMYTSAVLDAGQGAEWLDLSWTGSTPAGGSVGFETRSGLNPVVDGTWSDWAAVNSPIASPNGRYLQYRATLTTGDTKSTPVVEEVAIAYGAIPTAGTLDSFEAEAAGAYVALNWETAVEIDTLGFNLYRAESLSGQRVKINEGLIAAQMPGSPLGASYAYADERVEVGVSYFYWLEEVESDGKLTVHGPVEAKLNLLRRLLPARPRPLPLVPSLEAR